MKIIYIEDTFINIENITALQVVDELNNKVKMIKLNQTFTIY